MSSWLFGQLAGVAMLFSYDNCSALTQRTISSMLRPTQAGYSSDNINLFSGLMMKTARIVSGRDWSLLVPGSIMPYAVEMDRSGSPMMGNLTSILFSQWATTSRSQSVWLLTGSTDSVATRQSMAESSSYFKARRPISVVQTGVKSAGWEKRMAHLPFFHSWNESQFPWVVSHLKSGTMLPRRRRLSVDFSGYKLMYIVVPESMPETLAPTGLDILESKKFALWRPKENAVAVETLARLSQ